MSNLRVCKKCKKPKPLTTEYYNLLSTGYYRGSCKSCMAANTKKHYDTHPEKVLKRVAKYNEQKRQAGGYCDEVEKQKIREFQKDICYYCGDLLNFGGELDHKLPVSKGGNSWPENMVLACLTCNRDKHGKTANEFFKWRKSLKLPVNTRFYK